MTGFDVAEVPRALGSLGTNVVVIAAAAEGHRHGCIANVWGEEIDPPLVAIALRRSSRTLAMVERSGRFAVSVLGVTSTDLVAGLSDPLGPGEDRFEELETDDSPAGLPTLRRAVAALDCEVDAVSPFGLQTIIIGRVTSARVPGDDPDPLIFYGGGLWSLGMRVGAAQL